MTDGGWVDDDAILLENWTPGMNIRAVNYCVKDSGYSKGIFLSMQLMVGNPESKDPNDWISLRKHGEDGGSCH